MNKFSSCFPSLCKTLNALIDGQRGVHRVREAETLCLRLTVIFSAFQQLPVIVVILLDLPFCFLLYAVYRTNLENEIKWSVILSLYILVAKIPIYFRVTRI